MYFSTSTFKSVISWLCAECMEGRISTTGQSAGLGAVPVWKERLLLPSGSCRGWPDASRTHSPNSSWRSLCLERTEKVCGSSCPARNRELCCIVSKQRTAPALFYSACSKINIHGGTRHTTIALSAQWKTPFYSLKLRDMKHLNLQLHTPSLGFEMEAVWKMMKNPYKDYFLNLCIWIPVRML